jgi:hypothetical protein
MNENQESKENMMEDLISQDNSHVENKEDYYYFHGTVHQENKYMDIIDSDDDQQQNDESFEDVDNDIYDEIIEEQKEVDDNPKPKDKKNDTSLMTSNTFNLD